MKARPDRPMVRISTIKALLQRFSFVLFVFLSIALMVFGRVEPFMVDAVRARVSDAFAPILNAMSRPAATVARFLESINTMIELHTENNRLRVENAKLLQWQQAALRLEAENRSLRSLLEFQPGPTASFVSARVIANPGGSFVNAFLVTAGQRHGVRKGQAAIAGPGMVGRVVEVGDWSARILLVTDINTRIPVVIESSRQRAILAGDNSELPQLIYLPPEAAVHPRDRIVTSGHGGMFPPGLPIGEVMSVTDRGIKVQPLVDLGRVEHVQIVDFSLPAGVIYDMAEHADLP